MVVIRAKQITKMLGISLPTLWRWEKAGKFPKKRKLAPGTVGWIESEVIDWIETRPGVNGLSIVSGVGTKIESKERILALISELREQVKKL